MFIEKPREVIYPSLYYIPPTIFFYPTNLQVSNYQIFTSSEYSVDPDQLASKTSWSGPTLISKQDIYKFKHDKG